MAGRNTGEMVRGTFYFRTWLVLAVTYWGGRWLLSPSIKALNSEQGGGITRPWGDNKSSFSYMKCCWQGRRPRDWRFLSSSLTWPMGQSQSEQVTDPYGTRTSGILLILFWKVAAVCLGASLAARVSRTADQNPRFSSVPVCWHSQFGQPQSLKSVFFLVGRYWFQSCAETFLYGLMWKYLWSWH